MFDGARTGGAQMIKQKGAQTCLNTRELGWRANARTESPRDWRDLEVRCQMALIF